MKSSKSFVITNPLDNNKYLVHSCLEGPEVGVYYRGNGEIKDDYTATTITLPNYVDRLCMKDYYTVIVTPTFDETDFTPHNLNNIKLMASNVHNGKFKVYGLKCNFNWVVFGKRFSLDTSPNKNSVIVRGNGPYTYLETSIENTLFSEGEF